MVRMSKVHSRRPGEKTHRDRLVHERYYPRQQLLERPSSVQSLAKPQATISENIEKRGIEVKFAEKSSRAILNALNEHGFCWRKYRSKPGHYLTKNPRQPKSIGNKKWSYLSLPRIEKKVSVTEDIDVSVKGQIQIDPIRPVKISSKITLESKEIEVGGSVQPNVFNPKDLKPRPHIKSSKIKIEGY